MNLDGEIPNAIADYFRTVFRLEDFQKQSAWLIKLRL